MCTENGLSSQERVGVVCSVKAKEHICTVRWLDNDTIEDVSAYSIAMHSTFDFRMGDIVLKLPPVHNLSSESTSTKQKTEVDANANSSSIWVGEIIGIHDGKLTVCWSHSPTNKKVNNPHILQDNNNTTTPSLISRTISVVEPSEVFVLHR